MKGGMTGASLPRQVQNKKSRKKSKGGETLLPTHLLTIILAQNLQIAKPVSELLHFPFSSGLPFLAGINVVAIGTGLNMNIATKRGLCLELVVTVTAIHCHGFALRMDFCLHNIFPLNFSNIIRNWCLVFNS